MPSQPTGNLKSLIYLCLSYDGGIDLYRDFPGGAPGAFRKIVIRSTNEYPLGRKGYTLTECWRKMKEIHTVGMLILDADVAIDPASFAIMDNACRSDSKSIHLAPARIWPKSTGYPHEVWAHRKFGTQLKEWRQFRTDVDTGSFCFTYIPGSLWDAAIGAGLAKWEFPHVDKELFALARVREIPINVVETCQVIHMNY